MTASQRACQTTNIVLVDAPLTHRARLTATRLSMNVKTGVHAFRTVLKGVINVQVDFVVARSSIRTPTLFSVREKSEHFNFTILTSLDFSPKKKMFEGEYTACIINCAPADFSCYGYCSREFEENTQKCPCGAKCPTGCPCREYRKGFIQIRISDSKFDKPTKSCPVTTTQTTTTTTPAPLNTSVLILSPARDKPEYIRDATGNVKLAGVDFEFSLGQDTEVFYSCSLTWRGQFFIFGGDKEKSQISTINGCRLERVGSLAFDQTYGGCANVNDQSIYLCFNSAPADYKQCRVANDPFETFHEIDETVYNHRETLIGASRGKS